MDSCKFGLLLALSTGVRIGELCALQWCNINIREQTIKIAATLQRLHDTDMQGETIIIAEHRLYYLMDLADRFLCVQKGKIVREFTAQQMKALTNQEIKMLGLRIPDLHQIERTEIQSAATREGSKPFNGSSRNNKSG